MGIPSWRVAAKESNTPKRHCYLDSVEVSSAYRNVSVIGVLFSSDSFCFKNVFLAAHLKVYFLSEYLEMMDSRQVLISNIHKDLRLLMNNKTLKSNGIIFLMSTISKCLLILSAYVTKSSGSPLESCKHSL